MAFFSTNSAKKGSFVKGLSGIIAARASLGVFAIEPMLAWLAIAPIAHVPGSRVQFLLSCCFGSAICWRVFMGNEDLDLWCFENCKHIFRCLSIESSLTNC